MPAIRFGRRHVAPLLARFTAQHPGLEVHFILSDAGLEVEADACDVVLRFGLPSDEGMVARKITSTPQILCAAPSYLARRGAPRSPEDLNGHNGLRLTAASLPVRRQQWPCFAVLPQQRFFR
jgi:LysR family transcriptional regulator, transcriptional activator for dmlA